MLIAWLAATAFALEFQVDLPAEGQKCFGEYLHSGEPVSIYVRSKGIVITVHDETGDGNLYQAEDQLKVSAYAGHTGKYFVCFRSTTSAPVLVTMTLKHGVELHDETTVATASDKVKLSKQISELSKTIDNISFFIDEKIVYVARIKEMYDLLTLKTTLFSLFGVLVLLAAGYCQYSEIKRLLRIRKKI